MCSWQHSVGIHLLYFLLCYALFSILLHALVLFPSLLCVILCSLARNYFISPLLCLVLSSLCIARGILLCSVAFRDLMVLRLGFGSSCFSHSAQNSTSLSSCLFPVSN